MRAWIGSGGKNRLSGMKCRTAPFRLPYLLCRAEYNTVDDSLEYGFCFFQIAFMDDKIKVCTCRFILNGHISLIEKLPVIILQCGSAVNGGQAFLV